MEYLSYKDIAAQLDRIRPGSVVYLVSDIMQLVFACKKHGESFDANAFIDSLQRKIGPEGTLMIPAFSWDFCKGIPFDARTTRSRVGVLGDIAVQRADFVRTRHPMYSFAVWGKDAQALYDADCISSFGADSSFAYMHRADALTLVVGLSPLAGTTFVHYVEQCMHVPYRYEKSFTGLCTDANGVTAEKTVTMFVRELALNSEYLTGLDDVLTELNIAHTDVIDTVPFHTIYLRELYPVVAADICCNEARHLYAYDRVKFPYDYAPCRRYFK
ncbi:MAG: AAC(3) family N-acetyltransferase [Ruthenibacterium sp.]